MSKFSQKINTREINCFTVYGTETGIQNNQKTIYMKRLKEAKYFVVIDDATTDSYKNKYVFITFIYMQL